MNINILHEYKYSNTYDYNTYDTIYTYVRYIRMNIIILILN